MKGLALSLASILIFLGIAEAEALLQRFAVVAARLGAKPVVLFLPGKGETAEDKERRDHLRAWSEARSIPFHDLTRTIHAAGVAATYIPGNWHWNEVGHRLAGDALHAALLAGPLRDKGSVAEGRFPTPPWTAPREYCLDAVPASARAVADSARDPGA
jgi:hypothetical protein